MNVNIVETEEDPIRKIIGFAIDKGLIANDDESN